MVEDERKNKKGVLKFTGHLFFKTLKRSVAAGTTGTAGTASGLSKVYIGIKAESHPCKIDLNNLGFFHKFFVNNELKPFNIKRIICIFRLIQSHGK